MTHLLHIDTSPRGARSHTRRLTREFVDLLEKVRPADTVTYRDVGSGSRSLSLMRGRELPS